MFITRLPVRELISLVPSLEGTPVTFDVFHFRRSFYLEMFHSAQKNALAKERRQSVLNGKKRSRLFSSSLLMIYKDTAYSQRIGTSAIMMAKRNASRDFLSTTSPYCNATQYPSPSTSSVTSTSLTREKTVSSKLIHHTLGYLRCPSSNVKQLWC